MGRGGGHHPPIAKTVPRRRWLAWHLGVSLPSYVLAAKGCFFGDRPRDDGKRRRGGREKERKKKVILPPSLPPPSPRVRVSSVSSGVPGVHTLTQSQSSVHILYPLCTRLLLVLRYFHESKGRGKRVKRVLLSQWISLQETPTCPVQDIPPINMSLSKKDFSFSPSYKPPHPPIPA